MTVDCSPYFPFFADFPLRAIAHGNPRIVDGLVRPNGRVYETPMKKQSAFISNLLAEMMDEQWNWPCT
jgi:hypothetical protein